MITLNTEIIILVAVVIWHVSHDTQWHALMITLPNSNHLQPVINATRFRGLDISQMNCTDCSFKTNEHNNLAQVLGSLQPFTSQEVFSSPTGCKALLVSSFHHTRRSDCKAAADFLSAAWEFCCCTDHITQHFGIGCLPPSALSELEHYWGIFTRSLHKRSDYTKENHNT